MQGKQEIIEWLIGDDIDTIRKGETSGIEHILRNGFRGYDNLSYKSLLKEYEERKPQ